MATRFSRLRKATSPDEVKRSKRRTEMIKTIMIITFLYIAIELPCNIYSGYFFYVSYSVDIGSFLNPLINNIQFSYPAFNIFILYFSNKMFAKEIKVLFGLDKPNRYSGNTSFIATTSLKSSLMLNQKNFKFQIN